MSVLDEPLARGRFHPPQRSDAFKNPSAAIVDDDHPKPNITLELRHDPRRVRIVNHREIADDAPVVRSLAPSKKGRELAINAIRSAVRFDGEAARIARGHEVPLPDRKAVAEVDAGVGRDLMRKGAHHRQFRSRLTIEDARKFSSLLPI